MKKYYSNYAYIYPDKYLKDVVVHMDDSNNIIEVAEFEKEIENLNYHQGLLLFVPNTMRINPYLIDCTKEQVKLKFDYNTDEPLAVKAIICNLED